MASSSSNSIVSIPPSANRTLPNLRVVSVLVTIPEFGRISNNEFNVPNNSNRVVDVTVEHSVNVHKALEQPSNSSIRQNGLLVNESNQSPIASPNYSNVDSSVQATPCQQIQIKEEHDDINTSNVVNRNIETNPSQLVQNVIGNGDHLIGLENIVSTDNYTQGHDALTLPPTTQQSSNLPVNVDSPVQATPYQDNHIKDEPDDINSNNVDNENTQTDQMQLEQNSIENVYNLIGQANIVSTDGYNQGDDALIVPLVPPQSSNSPSNFDASLQATPYQENPIKEEPDDLNTDNVLNSYTGSDHLQLEQNSTENGDHRIEQAGIVSTDDNIQVVYRPSPMSMPFPPPQSSNAPPLHAPHPTDENEHFYCHSECDCASCLNIKQYFTYNNIILGTGAVYTNQSLEEVMNGAGDQQQQHQPQVFQEVANDDTNEVTFPSEPSNSATSDRQLQPQDSNVVVTGMDYEVPLQQASLEASINKQQNTNSSEQALSPSHEDSDEDEMSSESQLPAQALQDDAQMQVDLQALSQHNEVTTRSATNSQTASRNEMIDVIAGPSGQKSSNATSPTNNSSQIFTTENELFYCPHEACLVSENSEEKVLGHIVAVHLPQLGLGVRNGKRVVNQVDIMSQFGTLQNGVATRSTTKRQTGGNHENDIEAIADPSKQTSSKANSPTETDESVTNLRRSCRMAEPKGSYVMLEEDDENDMESEFNPSDTEENDDDGDYDEEQQQVVPSRPVKRVRSESSSSLSSVNEDDGEQDEEAVRSAKIPRISKTQRVDNKSESERSNQSTIKTRTNRTSKPEKKNGPNRNAQPNIKTHYEILSLNCIKCDKVIKDEEDIDEALNDHLESVHSYKRNRCYAKDCEDISFDTQPQLTNHRCVVHKNTTGWQCPKCPKLFKSVENCDSIVNNRARAKNHYIKMHNSLGKRPVKSLASPWSSTKQKEMDTVALQCSVCYENKKEPAMFAKDKFDKHMKKEHSIHRYRCAVKDCKESFHELSHRNTTKWQCDKCDAYFETYLKMYLHIFKEHQIGDFLCSFCSYKLTRVNTSEMFNHYVQEHAQMKNCTYPGCSYQTEIERNMKKHQRIHDGIKPFRCKWSQCDYASNEQSAVNRHIRYKHFKPNPNLVQDGAEQKDYVEVLKHLL